MQLAVMLTAKKLTQTGRNAYFVNFWRFKEAKQTWKGKQYWVNSSSERRDVVVLHTEILDALLWWNDTTMTLLEEGSLSGRDSPFATSFSPGWGETSEQFGILDYHPKDTGQGSNTVTQKEINTAWG